MKVRDVLMGALGIAAGGAIMKAFKSGRQISGVRGRRKSPGKFALELGAGMLQSKTPLDQFNLYLSGFHPMRDDPDQQVEAHHYCRIMNEDFTQCVVFDGNGPNARLTGVEFIVSEHLFEKLPEEEKKLWHPHNYEILSGQLVAPGIPERVERELMRRMMNSYGKTWHFWETDEEEVPHGEPCLAWSFNRDGEMDEHMSEQRDESMGISSEKRRKYRRELAALANPQRGVDLLEGDFRQATEPFPGVRDQSSDSAGEIGESGGEHRPDR